MMIWAWLCVGAGLWGLGSVIHSLFRTSEGILFGWQIANTGAILAPLWYIHFVFLYLNKPQRILLPVIYLLTGFFIFLTWFFPVKILGHLHLLFNEFYFTRVDWHVNPYYPAFYFIFDCVLLTYSFLHLFIALFSATGERRNQIKYLVLGSIVGWIGGHGGWVTVFFPSVYPYANYCVGIYPLIIGYAMVRHHLMDINLVFKKSLVYSILITIVSVIYFTSVVIFERLFQHVVGYNSTFFTIGTILVIAMIFSPLKNRVQDFVDRTFFKKTAFQMAEENEMLRQEVARAERYKTLASLTSGIVEGIKDPLTTLKGYGHFLKQKQDDKAFMQKFIQIHETEVNRINDILEQLIHYSSPTPLSRQNIEIARLLNETLGMLKSRIVENKIELIQDIKTSSGTQLNLDPSQMRQALSNIIINAVEAMPNGGKLEIKTEETADKIRIIVRDTGAGVPKNEQMKIFDPFYTTKSGHTGLGLSVTQGIVENHNGKIRILSAEGQGTEFIIELPVVLQPTAV